MKPMMSPMQPAMQPMQSAADEADFDAVYKIILVGDTGVGKTSLLHRLTDETNGSQKHPVRMPPTIGVDFFFKSISIDDARVKLHLWDATGQQRYRMITSSYQRVAHAIIFVYDCSRRSTLESVSLWASEADKLATKHVCRVLVGCKSDATRGGASSTRGDPVTLDEAKRFAARLGIEHVIETSAATGVNVEAAFAAAARGAREQLTRAATLRHPVEASGASWLWASPASVADLHPTKRQTTGSWLAGNAMQLCCLPCIGVAQCLGLVDARATHMTWARVGEQQELTHLTVEGRTRATSVSMDGGSRRAASIDGGRRTESRTLLQPASSARSPGRGEPGRGTFGGGARGTFGGGTRGTFSEFSTPDRPVRSLRGTVGSDSDARGLLR